MNQKSLYQRPDGRTVDQIRPATLQNNIAPSAAGSVLMSMGNTQVICAASVEDSVPRWMSAQKKVGGWVTAEYSMLPYSTGDRNRREAATGKIGGRTQEIQRLIGRSLRAVVDLKKLGPRTVWLDCDVLQADGGTRTAAITGAYVALRQVLNRLMEAGQIAEDPMPDQVAAVSVGIVEKTPLLDLCYLEDVAAEVDMNVVMTSAGKFVEVQGTAEEHPFTHAEFQKMLIQAEQGIGELFKVQADALK